MVDAGVSGAGEASWMSRFSGWISGSDGRSTHSAMAMGDLKPFEGEVTLTVTAFVAIPKSFSRARRTSAVTGEQHPTTRPDADNYAKAALDGCNGILFRDDSQVTDLIVRKRYAADPCLVVTMEAL